MVNEITRSGADLALSTWWERTRSPSSGTAWAWACVPVQQARNLALNLE